MVASPQQARARTLAVSTFTSFCLTMCSRCSAMAVASPSAYGLDVSTLAGAGGNALLSGPPMSAHRSSQAR